jgi:multidrug efflux pump subunit AcrB
MVMWPGATAQQMQDEVLNRMEKKFEQLDHFEKVVTFARQGYAGMTLTVKGGTSTRISAKRGTRRARSSATSSSSCRRRHRPDLQRRIRRRDGLLYAVKGDGIDQWELSDIAEDIKRRLLKVPMVKKVDIYGKQAKKVYVEFSNERLAALGITPLQIAESLRSQNMVLASGQVDTHPTV